MLQGRPEMHLKKCIFFPMMIPIDTRPRTACKILPPNVTLFWRRLQTHTYDDSQLLSRLLKIPQQLKSGATLPCDKLLSVLKC